MSTKKRVSKTLTTLCDCAIMIALAFVLSCAVIYKMPMGGSVTVASMLPIMLISIRFGPITGLGTAFVYSLTQLLQAVASGDVFPYCEGAGTIIVCVLFDYIVPFTLLGLAGLLYKLKVTKNSEINIYLGITSVVLLRFLCHFITGVVIWRQWAPDGMGKYLYSFLYNGGFLSFDFLICIIAAILIFRRAEMRKLFGIAD